MTERPDRVVGVAVALVAVGLLQGPRWQQGVAAASAAMIGVVGVVSLVDLATIEPGSYAAVDAALADRGIVDGATVMVLGPSVIATHHLPDHVVVAGVAPVEAADADMVLVDITSVVTNGQPEIRGPVATEDLGPLQLVVFDPPDPLPE